MQYVIRKDAENVNFDITITSTTQTITMQTKYVKQAVIVKNGFNIIISRRHCQIFFTYSENH